MNEEFRSRMEGAALRLLGEPASKTKTEWRYGRHGSLSIDLKKGVWRDHESGEGGGVLALVERETGLRGRAAAEWLGLPPTAPDYHRHRAPKGPAPVSLASSEEVQDRKDRARALWEQGLPAPGTLVEIYLRARGVALPPDPDVLRFHPRCPRQTERLPAMLALMTDPVTNEPTGVHRTFLCPDGTGKAEGEPKKAMLGEAGVIRLSPDEDVTIGLGLAEGIETALSILATEWAPVWAATSAGGIRTFPVLPGIECLTLFADTDSAGLTAARACAQRWAGAGREALVRAPFKQRADWNDIMKGAA